MDEQEKAMTTQRKRSTKKPIPSFASRQEEAEFWDTHSPLDFQFKTDVEIKASGSIRHLLIPLDAQTIHALGDIARARGLEGASSLAREWLLERLASEPDSDSPRRTRVKRRPNTGDA
jgi:hypothetical protein